MSETTTLRRLYDLLLPYDALTRLGRSDTPLWRDARTVLAAIPVAMTLLAAFLIWNRHVDNQGAICSSALPHCWSIAQNPSQWLSTSLWSQVTPSPGHNGFIALLFGVFGYDTRIAMMGTAVVSMIACFLIGIIAARRFGTVSGVIAQVLFITTPTILSFSLSGGYYLWGVTPLIGAIAATDCYASSRAVRYYFLSAVLVALAGMSRPEIFAMAIPLGLFVYAPWWSRPIYFLVAWAFPLTGVVVTQLRGEAVPGAISVRSFESTFSAVVVWFAEMSEFLEGNFFNLVFVVGGIVFLLVYGALRGRFLAAVALSYWGIFLALHCVGRLEQNFPHYYIGPSVLLVIFLAGALAATGRKLVLLLEGRPAWVRGCGIALLTVLALWLARPVERAQATVAAATYKVEEGLRQVRDYILAEAGPDDNVIYDYTGDMVWLLAETNSAGSQRKWGYYLNPLPRPVPGLASTPGEFETMRTWTREGLDEWLWQTSPELLVSINDEQYRGVANSPHHRMYSLRSALNHESFYEGKSAQVGDQVLHFGNMVALGDWEVYRVTTEVGAMDTSGNPDTLVRNGEFTAWDEQGHPVDWRVQGTKIVPASEEFEGAVSMMPEGATQDRRLLQRIPLDESMAGRPFSLTMRAMSTDAGKLGVNLYYEIGDERKAVPLTHSGGGDWEELGAKFILPAEADPKSLLLMIVWRKNASGVNIIDWVRLAPVE